MQRPSPFQLLLPLSGAALLLLLLSPLPPSGAQNAWYDLFKGFECVANRSVYPCQGYALYNADATVLSALDLASVGDLFGVSRLMLARANKLSTSSSLHHGQPLLIPLSCSCLANHSYAPAAYEINSGDTFYLVSTGKFDNLTTYPAVELINPQFVPTNLSIGDIVNFPVFCQCPDRNLSSLISTTGGRKVSGLVTYVPQPADTYSSIASNFGTDVQSLTNLNGPDGNKTFTTILVPLFKGEQPPLLQSNASTNSTPSSPPPAASPTVITRTRHKGVIAGLAAALGVTAALLLLLLLLFARYRRRAESEEGKGGGAGAVMASKSDRTLGGLVTEEDKLIMDLSEWLDKYRVFKMEELRRATSDFHESCLIKGTVYKGTLDEEVVAVKKMKWNASDELKILQKVNHANLVKLEGFCIDSAAGTCYLVYEYVENGSLDDWIHDPDASPQLDWRARLRVALDIANGLQYIHEHTWPRVVHKDVKTSNVLLDANLRAKIANFGLAKSGFNAVTTNIIGTQGYISPEYLVDGLVTTKMDVFAFGVVLLELVSGKEAVDEYGEALWMDVEKLFDEKDGRSEAKVLEWMDGTLVKQGCHMESVISVLGVARACLQKDPSKRPSMVDVAYTLSKAEELFADYSGDTASAVSSSDVLGR